MADLAIGDFVVVRIPVQGGHVVGASGRLAGYEKNGLVVVVTDFGVLRVEESRVEKYVPPEESIKELVELLALWFSRFQGYTAGTPDDMVTRTREALVRNGRPPRKPEVQGG